MVNQEAGTCKKSDIGSGKGAAAGRPGGSLAAELRAQAGHVVGSGLVLAGFAGRLEFATVRIARLLQSTGGIFCWTHWRKAGPAWPLHS